MRAIAYLVTASCLAGLAGCSKGAPVCAGTELACAVTSDCTSATACINETCTGGCCVGAPADAGTICADDNGSVCDGKGKCVECLQATDCPEPSTKCKINSCNATTHVCGASNATEGTSCDDNAGTVCDTNGDCIACLTSSDCTAATSDCIANSCDPIAHTCGTTNAPADTPCTDGGTLCNLFGDCVECLKDSDCAPTQLACVANLCGLSSEACTLTNLPSGTPCIADGGTSPSCAGYTLTFATSCDGLGGCDGDAGTAPCSAGFICASDGGGCATTCGAGNDAGDSECQPAFWCDEINGGACQPAEPTGDTCTRDRQCDSLSCDGGACE